MDFSAISLRIKSIGDREALAALDQIDTKAQATAKQVNDIFDNTLYKGSLRDAERDYDRLVNAWRKDSDQAAVAVQNVSTKISGLGTRLQSLATTGSIMGATLAEGGAYGVTRFARSIANLGFAVDPVVGGITILAATVGTALFEAFEKSKKEAEAFRKSLTDLINAGQTAKIGEKIYDVEVGTAAENYEDGLVALKAKLATVEARFKEMHLGGQSAQILELQGKIATAQSKLDELLRAQQLAMRSSAYYDQQNEASGKADKKDESADLRDATGDFGDGADRLAGIRAAAKAAVKGWDERNAAIVHAMEKNHTELAETYDRLNADLGKHIKAVTGKDNPLRAMEDEISKEFGRAQERIETTITSGMAHTIGQSIHDGIMAGFSGGGIAGAFKALTKAMLAGVGQMLTSLGEVYLEYGGIMQALAGLLPNPFTAGAAGLAIGAALIAMGAALGSVATGGGGGGSRGGYGASSGYSGASTVIATGIVSPGAPAGTATPAGSVQGRPTVNNHNYIIGPADPVAQRAWDELQRRSLQRGSIRGA